MFKQTIFLCFLFIITIWEVDFCFYISVCYTIFWFDDDEYALDSLLT